MTPNEHALSDRALGQFPLSVGTSLALESALNIHPETKHPRPFLSDHNEFWVNLRTLYRNMMTSMTSEAQGALLPVPIANALLAEMEQLLVLVPEKSMGRCKCVFYVSNYKDLERKYPHAKVRVDNTPKQKIFTAMLGKSIQALLEMLQKRGGNMDIRVFDLKITTAKATKALMLTHVPYDLLAYYSFEDLVLLESNTGAPKPRSLFYTKYLNGNDLPMIPFREDFLQVFGDKELFQPMDIKVRRELIEIAKQFNWSQITTKDRIRQGIDTMKDPYAKEVLKSMLV